MVDVDIDISKLTPDPNWIQSGRGLGVAWQGQIPKPGTLCISNTNVNANANADANANSNTNANANANSMQELFSRAIRGWNDEAGFSRLLALYEVGVKSQMLNENANANANAKPNSNANANANSNSNAKPNEELCGALVVYQT